MKNVHREPRGNAATHSAGTRLPSDKIKIAGSAVGGISKRPRSSSRIVSSTLSTTACASFGFPVFSDRLYVPPQYRNRIRNRTAIGSNSKLAIAVPHFRSSFWGVRSCGLACSRWTHLWQGNATADRSGVNRCESHANPRGVRNVSDFWRPIKKGLTAIRRKSLLHNWPRRESNPHVPYGTRDFKSRASAYSATRPGLRICRNLARGSPPLAITGGIRRRRGSASQYTKRRAAERERDAPVQAASGGSQLCVGHAFRT